ncbi:phosphoenolpyruvate synthase|nr:phosphoenolpyruvate synthase [Dendrosporobacter quercicolus DSM 1736]
MMNYVLPFDELDKSSLPLVGGKGANLAELSRASFPVPGGFCITTAAYRDFILTSPAIGQLIHSLETIDTNNLTQLRQAGEMIRAQLTQLPMPERLQAAIVQAWINTGPNYAYAVRSSATAEDLPTASFAGQQDTYLNIKGRSELLLHVRRCWASLFTDRAIAYRAKNHFNHRDVLLAVVVQRMVQPEVSGIMFTADPVNGNRTVISINASFGLGEAIVSGIVSADLYKIKAQKIIHKQIAEKKIAIYSLADGGTVTQKLPTAQQRRQALSDQQLLALAELGQNIQAHFASPQDIEFCVEKGGIFIVQSRPITSLYPLADLPLQPLRVLTSFGHVQMMTDAMPPLGTSILQNIFSKELCRVVGGRIYGDLSDLLQNKLIRKVLSKSIVFANESIGRAVAQVIQRPEFIQGAANSSLSNKALAVLKPLVGKAWKNLYRNDPHLFKEQVEEYMDTVLRKVRQDLAGLEGPARLLEVKHQLDYILQHVFTIVPYVLPGLLALVILKNRLVHWTGSESDELLAKLNKSLPGNITSEMGLQIGDLADLLRQLPEVAAYLETAENATFYAGLDQVSGGATFAEAFTAFIEKFGMRCPGEIDLTRPRWREAPAQLAPAILNHMRNVQPQEHRRKFVRGALEANAARQQIVAKVQGNYFRSKFAKRIIDVFRSSGALREHHKYLLVNIMDECKKAIEAEAEVLVTKGLLTCKKDVFYFTFDEFRQLVQGAAMPAVNQTLAARKELFAWHKTLRAPGVMTSEGEIVIVPLERSGIPAGALAGSPVSAGVVQGRARIILHPEQAFLQPGEILIAPHTDPGWTPLFHSARGLVTEVGGLMTHGAVVAREYGIPAVVGVDRATELIKNGQTIRLDGNQGFIELIGNENE